MTPSTSPGLPVRRLAAEILDAVLRKKRPLDETLAGKGDMLAELEERDRALTRNLVATVLRRRGTLAQLLQRALPRGLPAQAPKVEMALLLGAAQIFFLQVADHAAVDLSVRLVQEDRHAARFAKLVNAVLRQLARTQQTALAEIDATADTPSWLMVRWVKAYGEETARAIAQANGQEASLDLSVKSNPEQWAETLGGRVLRNGTLRIATGGAVAVLPGYGEGTWWVQDAAATLPVHLLGDVRGMRVADLCAAPGGKAAQLAQRGAHVTAVDRSGSRLARLEENFARLKLEADIVVADAAQWRPSEPFDAILLDAPCLATGTIRRHPDLPWLKSEKDLAGLIALQTRLLDHAATLLKPSGLLVYCTCSLEPEEGEAAISSFLARHGDTFRKEPIEAEQVFGCAEFVTNTGDLRTLPFHWPDVDSRMAGLDGFFASRLRRI